MMQLSIQLNFDRPTLTRLFTTAVRKWSGLYQIDSLTISCDADGRASGYAMMKFAGKTSMINFEHDVIVAGVCQASAAEGNPIDRASLAFKYHEGRGYGGGTSVSATANPATAESADAMSCVSSDTSEKSGAICFPGTVTVNFGIDELTDLLKAAAKRAGADATHATVSFTDKQNCSANITVKTKGGASGTISMGSKQMNETLAEELTARGYTVAADGFRYSYSKGGFGNRSGTSMTVSLTAIPK
ncbi:MAG: hypothetical protein WC714_19880 [Candidatus Obscuribacterales bacterium]|jgi:hypothetical protein